ncbi:histone lysine demethylase PHF8-like isoform X5 [Antechinus flavipes]|uniref:histone lysine demethylase PHF8-like isoform X3 n=1 Tax=Antechinus flavipes TaxID=38775 RepID=UPI0022355CC2|nr:histone lysine demethylase PHF8-like isoform X3 [Antechinus flavipes]XP_051824346.1 histone lysine demethylase PHF8-like isoform X4 [Antechinus flavipes]XP_051824347.1 histone lysine demethylase PHF8-like isoform X5 [Antechinus flavipes]
MKARSKPQAKLVIHEESDPGSKEQLMVEKTPEKEKAPTKFHQKLLPASPYSDPKRIRKPGEVELETEENYAAEKKVEEGGEAEAESPGGACGSLYLLKASRQLGEPDCVGHNKAPASPNTLEAVQGMLCLANLPPVSSSSPASHVQAWWTSGEYSGRSGSPREKGSGPLASQGTGKKKAVKQLASDSTESQGGEVKTHKLENVENSVNKSLEDSSKDKEYKLKAKKKKKSANDAPWIPKAQGVPSLPKSAREGTIASSMDSRMAGTATKLSQQGSLNVLE